MEKYGEILFLGPCNLHCYYCLSNEMAKLKKDNNNQLNTHFSQWKSFVQYLTVLKKEGVGKVYLSSVTTEPMLYRYLGELISFLQEQGLKVGIRTNGYLAIEKMDELLLCDEEISFSINSLKPDSNKKICGKPSVPDFHSVFTSFIEQNKKCRVSVVVNRFNKDEIKDILVFLSSYSCIDYVQLRQVYKYGDREKEDCFAFEEVERWLSENADLVGSYYESPIYGFHGLNVSLWRDVFRKESVSSYNYFTNGLLSNDSLLIPAYEERKGEIYV